MAKKPINHYDHPDKLPNIPTQELSGFANSDDAESTRYPRDIALDPQLVWKGKDQENNNDLEIQAVPIYIHEHVQPQAIIEMLQAQEQNGDATASLFEGFDMLALDQKIEFYQHEQNWHNRFILGDSLVVMNSLAEKEQFKKQVQMIYIDPPYGVKFKSNWQVSTRKSNVEDTDEDVTPQPEQIKAYQDTWELGIHSYLAYLRDRLTVACELLADSGSIFVQISEQNVHQVRCLLDEVFGNTNFISIITWTRANMTSSTGLASISDYLLWYAKDKDQMKYRQLYMPWDARTPDPLLRRYTQVELADGTRRGMTQEEKKQPGLLPEDSRRYLELSVSSQTGGNAIFKYEFAGRDYTPPGRRGWSTSKDGLDRLAKQRRLIGKERALYYIRYTNDAIGRPITNIWMDTAGSLKKRYVVETHPKVIQRCMLMTTDPGDLVLDPTCGSGTTAYVAEQWGRRWITVDTLRVALALARARLMSAKYPYYRLQDTHDIKKGFNYKTAPYVSLSDMANNTDIDIIHAKYSEKLDPLLELLNTHDGIDWKEWEAPNETNPSWDIEFKKLHQQYISLKRQRQNDMDASTAKCAKNETLYDQPLEDKKRVRVTGPFTVESLSPHLVVDPDEESERINPTPILEAEQDYHKYILEHLKSAGVQNRLEKDRINFDWLEEYPGEYIHAEGVYTDENGNMQNVAVSIGPQYSTVGKPWMWEAAKEAVSRVSEFNLLIVTGFAFEGYTADTDTRVGKLPILPVKMSPELMVQEFKNTGEGNLFMVFGEPDVEILESEEGTLSVKLKGVDVYNPVTGLARSNTPEDIACWFIDTAYNGEAFFVRHAYFTGENEPYEQLQRALKSEINEEAWQALYQTESLPFAKPETGKIAVKVINHFGDEVIKEYKV